MKVLYHHRTKSRDGQFIHIDELQRALQRRGHEVVEVSPTVGEDIPLGAESAAFSRLAAIPSARREPLEWGYNAISYRALARAIRRQRPDLIYERYALGNVAGVLAARRFGIPLFLEMNSPLADERQESGGLTFPRIARRVESYVTRRADCVFTVSEVLRAKLLAAGVPAERVVAAHNAVDPQRFDRSLSSAAAKHRLNLGQRPVIGFTGFVRGWHRVDRLVEVIAQRPSMLSQAQLLIVGDGDAVPELRVLAAARGVADRLTITGVVQRADLARYIAAFDIAIQPGSPAYASPLKLFEYMAMEKAIIMPDLPSIREVVRPDVEALLFRHDSDAELAAAVQALLENGALRQRLGRAAYARLVSQGYTWERNAERIEAQWAALRSQRHHE